VVRKNVFGHFVVIWSSCVIVVVVGEQVRVAVVTFDDEAELVFDLDEYKGRLQVR